MAALAKTTVERETHKKLPRGNRPKRVCRTLQLQQRIVCAVPLHQDQRHLHQCLQVPPREVSEHQTASRRSEKTKSLPRLETEQKHTDKHRNRKSKSTNRQKHQRRQSSSTRPQAMRATEHWPRPVKLTNNTIHPTLGQKEKNTAAKNQTLKSQIQKTQS